MWADMPASIFSWGLIIAGIIFAIIAAMAGYRMDDPYPGYGAVTQRHHRRCQDYADEVSDAIEGLRDIRDEAIETATDVREQLARQFAERGQVIGARSAFCQR